VRRIGARILPVSASQALNNTRLIGGPVRICGWSFSDGLTPSDLNATGTVAAPGAGATVASLSLPNGTYQVEWTVELAGTPGAGDVNNFALFIGAAQIATSVNLGANGNYPQENAQAQVTFGPLTLAVKAIGAATVGSSYTANIVVTQLNKNAATIFDGKMPIAQLSIGLGDVDTRWFDDYGITAETEVSVTGTLGTISGTIWYYLLSDLAEEPHHKTRHG
jgi:hypothetical protein